MDSAEGVPHSRRLPLSAAVSALVLVGVLGVVSVPVAVGGVGPGSPSSLVAQWARTHGLGGLVSWLEGARHAPSAPVPGAAFGSRSAAPTPSRAVTPSAGRATTVSVPQGPVAPGPLGVPAGLTPSPGEGQWRSLVVVDGRTAARVAQVRPDAIHTSSIVSVVWMDPSLLSFSLHAGTQVPGAVPGVESQLVGAERAAVWATFNSGFQMKDARGGYWQNGRSVVPLVSGAASMVLSSDGRLSVEAWPGGAPPAGVVAVRQNLSLLIDHGVEVPSVHSTVTSDWGRTVGNAAYVWRSGIGVRADGTVVQASGPSLTAATLAHALLSAGAQTAMELDINKDWTSFITYDQPGAVPHRLAADQVPSATRYLSPSARDFVAVLPRGVRG